MHFPIYFRIGGISLHPHFVMEFLAYAIGFQVYLALKRKFKDMIAPGERWQVIAAAAFGAALGSRLLGWLEAPVLAWQAGLTGGKTVIPDCLFRNMGRSAKARGILIGISIASVWRC